MKKAVLMIVALLVLSVHITAFAAEADFDVMTAPEGTATYHWWEEMLWKSGVKLDGKGIELKYLGDRLLINYFKFVPDDGTEPIIWTKFTSLLPAEALIEADGSQAYVGITDKWGIRTDANMGATGGQSLAAHTNMEQLPNVSFYPGLTGTYSIYISIRAVDAVSRVGLRLVD
ncbi:MAG: hypothetical protein M0Q40_10990 [Limnochordia bacterium]|nr:hypothetical protein [Limnochordia bacterium]MDD4517136.1 hypothetical protein [Limnochordia bacterium]